MRICEIIVENEILFEYGRKGFPGFGKVIFGQRYYEYMVDRLNYVHDEHARDWMIHWLSDLFKQDNPKFKPARFVEACAKKKDYNVQPKFEQRHFYYLAEFVKNINDPHIREFVRDWLADVAGSTNGQFKRSVWEKFCNPEDKISKMRQPIDSDAEVDKSSDILNVGHQELDEATGAPGFGSGGHGGFGQKFFRNAYYQYIAYKIRWLDDTVIKQHLTDWFAKVFKLDNPAFKPEVFANVALKSSDGMGRYPNAPKFEARHFYFLAHEVSEIQDHHEREFICDWLAHEIGRTNPYFNEKRWKKFCNLDDDNQDKKLVKIKRDRALPSEVNDV